MSSSDLKGATLRASSGNLQRNVSTASLSSMRYICPHCPLPKHALRKFSAYTNFHRVLSIVGNFGRYQKFLCFLTLYTTIMWAGNMFFDLFSYVDWKCEQSNQTISLNPYEPSFCDIYTPCISNITYGFKSVVWEWGFACSGADTQSYIQLASYSFRFLGAIVGGHLGDKVGRKTVLHAAMFVLCIAGVMTVSSSGWKSFIAWQSVTHFAVGFSEVVLFVLVLEFTDSKYRLLASSFFQYPLAFLVMPLVAYLTQGWRLFLIIMNFISSPILLGYLIIYASPRYLIQKGFLERAAEILNNMCSDQWNNKPKVWFTSDELYSLQRKLSHPTYTMVTLFKRSWMAKIISMQILAGITYGFVDQAFTIDIRDIYVFPKFAELAVIGVIQLIVVLMMLLADWKIPKIGRRWLFFISLALMIVLYGIIIILRGIGMSSGVVDSVLIMIASSIAMTMFRILLRLITLEAFPTVLRNTAVGVVLASEQIGNIVMTLIRFWKEKELAFGAFVVAEVFLIITFIAGIVFVPETKYQHLKESLDEQEHRVETAHVHDHDQHF